MKALLTGITGNLGYELSLDLIQRGDTLIPCVRPGRTGILLSHPAEFERVVECDLIENDIDFSEDIDCIVHCAGVVQFREAENKNAEMMRRIVSLARKLSVPVHFISTAYVYRPSGKEGRFNNSYEQDKYNAEELLKEAGVPYSIFRPSVLTGHSRTGEIRNFSGFYLMAQAFLSAIHAARAKDQIVRFPRMPGVSNMLPVDQVAKSIGGYIHSGQLETLFATNPMPPNSEWILEETLNFFNARDGVKLMDSSFQDFGNVDLTEEETKLYRFSRHFSPYWSMEYDFPPSICRENLIDQDYIMRALTFFRDSENFHGQNH